MTYANTTHTTTYFIESRTGEGTHQSPFNYKRVTQVTDVTAASQLVRDLNAADNGVHYGIIGVVDYQEA